MDITTIINSLQLVGLSVLALIIPLILVYIFNMKGAVNNFPDKMKSFFSLGFLLSFVFTAILFIFAGLINREFSNDFLITSPQFILLTISPELSIFFPYRIGSNLIVIGVLMGFIVSSVFIILRSNTCNSISSE